MTKSVDLYFATNKFSDATYISLDNHDFYNRPKLINYFDDNSYTKDYSWLNLKTVRYI